MRSPPTSSSSSAGDDRKQFGARTPFAVVFTPTDTDRYEPVNGYITVHLNLWHQSGFTADTVTDVTYSPDATYEITARGGQGEGAISYEVTTGADVIEITDSSYRTLKSGTAVITVTKLSDSTYANAVVKLTITVSHGTAEVTVTCADMTYGQSPSPSVATDSQGAVTYTYQGVDGTSYAESATAPTAAGGYRVTATVAQDDRYAEATGYTDFTISPARIAGTVTISGDAAVGSVLTAAYTASGDETVILQWSRGGTAVDGSVSETCTVTDADIGQTITVTATASDANHIGDVSCDLYIPKASQAAPAAGPENGSTLLYAGIAAALIVVIVAAVLLVRRR